MQHIEDVYVVLLLALGYPVVYSIEAFYQPINTDAYANQLERTDRSIRCAGFINLDLAARIYFWYLPVSVLAAHMILSRWKGQMTHALLWGLLAPHAFFYSVVLTVKCPPERTYTFQTLAFENKAIHNRPAVWNSTNSFIPIAVKMQWEMTIVFTAMAAVLFTLPLLLNGLGYTFWTAHPFKALATFLRFLGAVIFLSLNPTVDKLYDPPIDENCRRSLQNPERVFDTPESVYGIITSDIIVMCSIIIATGIIAGGCQFSKRPILQGIGTGCELISFITAGAFIARILYVQSNPGCMNGIKTVTSSTGRAGLTILALGWISPLFPHFLEERASYDPAKTEMW